MTDEMLSSGGFCAPISEAYALPHIDTRPIRDAMNEWFHRNMLRNQLPEEERIAFDINNYGYADDGYPDVAAIVCETRTDDDDDEDGYGYRYDHEWDKPITLRYSFRYLR